MIYGNRWISLQENVISKKDIYYNKSKFDNGDINLCFITGLSGSGKTTMADSMSGNNVEIYELDDVFTNFRFSDTDLKKYGDLIYSYFKSVGKSYRMDHDPIEEDWYTDEFEKGMCRTFIEHAMQYAKSHKNRKYVVEGVELYWCVNPEDLKDYAVYIKGTSAFLSRLRSAIRDSSDCQKPFRRFGIIIKNTFNIYRARAYEIAEKEIDKWRSYYDLR